MEIVEAIEVLNNHSLCLSGEMCSKPKQKEVIEAISIVAESFKNNSNIQHTKSGVFSIMDENGEYHNVISNSLIDALSILVKQNKITFAHALDLIKLKNY